MSESQTSANSGRKRIKLALQGGGSHGAFTWGVLDRLLEHGGFEVEAIVGASAGAMNAVVTAYGLAMGGPEGGRERLSAFWHGAAQISRSSLLQPSPLDRMLSKGNMTYSPLWRMHDGLSKMFSPYESSKRGKTVGGRALFSCRDSARPSLYVMCHRHRPFPR